MGQGQSGETNGKKIGLRLSSGMRCKKCSAGLRSLASIIIKGLCLGLLTLSFIPRQVTAAEDATQVSSQSRPLPAHEFAPVPLSIERQSVVAPLAKQADFEGEPKSRDARKVADWVVDSGDNCDLPFAVLDKVDAKVFVFYPDGRLRGAAPVLIGLAKGDDSIPGIGDRKMSDIRPEERTTPAGRFVSSLGRNANGHDVLWVDYDDAVALHRVITTNPKEHRQERLDTPTPLDNRISYGCINVPISFYDNVVTPAFTGTGGIVYVLPEVRSKSEIFLSYYDVEKRWGASAVGNLGAGTKVSRNKVFDPKENQKPVLKEEDEK